MKAADRWLQSWRIAKARPWIRHAQAVLDVGCADGALFRACPWITKAVGVDPDIEASREGAVELRRGLFPEAVEKGEKFDAITALAVFEHIPRDAQPGFVAACRDALEPSGLVVVTVPSPFVDKILHALEHLHLVDGMATHEHWGFTPQLTRGLFEKSGFRMVRHRRFELGLNHVFVFRAP